MSSTGPTLLEDPPSTSSSEGEEEDEMEEVEGEEEEEEEESEEEIADPKSSVKEPSTNLHPIPSAAPLRQSSDEGKEESDADAGSDSEPSPEKPKYSVPFRDVETSIQPITSKPMDGNLKHKKFVTNATTKSSTVAKRLFETDKAEKDSKPKKQNVSDAEEEDVDLEENGNKSGDDPKKVFQRLWSDEDEIVLLKGMVNYVKKGLNPTSSVNEFLDGIKKSLHVDVNRIQLNSKIQRLKQKYHSNARRAKHGVIPAFSKPHELKSYLLSKRIWGEKGVKDDDTEANNVGVDSVKTDGKGSKSRKTGNGLAALNPKALTLPEIPQEMTPIVEEEQSWSLYPCLSESLQFANDLIMPPPGLGESLVRGGVGFIGSLKVKELEQRWRELGVEGVKCYLDRIELVREQTKLMLDALESSKS